MHLLKKRSTRFYLGFFLVLALAIGGSSIAAFADSGTGATVAVTHGSLTQSGPGSTSATPVTLSGDDQTTTYSLGLTVTDATGSATGWDLTISATQFSDGSGHTLPSDAQYISAAPNVACASQNAAHNGTGHCTTPTNNVTYAPLTVTTSAQKFFNAAATTGLGSFTVTPVVNVLIPANTVIGAGPSTTFSSTVSVAVVSGP